MYTKLPKVPAAASSTVEENPLGLTQELYEKYTQIVGQNGLTIQNVPYAKYSCEYKELCWLAVQNTPLALRYVPDTLKTYELCEFAVRDTDMVWPYVPKKNQLFLLREFEERARGRLLLMLIVFILSSAGFFVLAFILGKVWWVFLPIIYALFCWLLYDKEHKALSRRLVVQTDVMSRSRELMKIQEEGNCNSRFVEVGGLCWYNEPLHAYFHYIGPKSYTEASEAHAELIKKEGLRLVTVDEWRAFEEKTYHGLHTQGKEKGMLFIDKTSGRNVFFPFWSDREESESSDQQVHPYQGEYRLDAGAVVKIQRNGICSIEPQHPLVAGLPVICVAL